MRPQMDAAQNKAARSDARTSPSVPPGTEGDPSRPRRSRSVSQQRDAEQLGQESAAARAAAAAAALQKLRKYGGYCWWCHTPAHDPDKCAAKPKPDMDDWVDAHAPPRESMRSRPELNVGGSSKKARRQTTRTTEEQRDYHRDYSSGVKLGSHGVSHGKSPAALVRVQESSEGSSGCHLRVLPRRRLGGVLIATTATSMFIKTGHLTLPQTSCLCRVWPSGA